jgi:hypothetical protein
MISITNKIELDLPEIVSRTAFPSDGSERTFRYCLQRSDRWWAGTVDGKVACVFGLIFPSLLSTSAYIWLLTTDLVDEHQFPFVRYSQICIKEVLSHCDEVRGHVDVRQPRSVRWLKWLGATVGRPQGFYASFIIRKPS